MQNKVNEYFKNNPDADKVFSTGDGFLFAMEMYATAHAATITDKEVTKHTREVKLNEAVPAAVEVPVTTETEGGAEIRTKDETVEAPKITDSQTEVEGKAEVVAEVTEQAAEAAKVAAEPVVEKKPAKTAKNTKK